MGSASEDQGGHSALLGGTFPSAAHYPSECVSARDGQDVYPEGGVPPDVNVENNETIECLDNRLNF